MYVCFLSQPEKIVTFAQLYFCELTVFASTNFFTQYYIRSIWVIEFLTIVKYKFLIGVVFRLGSEFESVSYRKNSRLHTLESKLS
jgi:hypothetical protein